MHTQNERDPSEDRAEQHNDRSGIEEREERTETVPTHHGPTGNGAEEDVVTDPALDDRLGSDWADEGGATTTGPATDTPGGRGAADGDDPKRPVRIDREREEEHDRDS